jgi:hypothetical protein
MHFSSKGEVKRKSLFEIRIACIGDAAGRGRWGAFACHAQGPGSTIGTGKKKKNNSQNLLK